MDSCDWYLSPMPSKLLPEKNAIDTTKRENLLGSNKKMSQCNIWLGIAFTNKIQHRIEESNG